MVRNDILRKRYAKRRIDGIIHDNLASVSKSLGPQQALERLLVYVPNRTDLLSPMPLGGEPSWTRAAYFFKGLVALAHNQAHWLRDVATWEPTGTSPRRQFGSLARHLLANHAGPQLHGPRMVHRSIEGSSPETKVVSAYWPWRRNQRHGHSRATDQADGPSFHARSRPLHGRGGIPLGPSPWPSAANRHWCEAVNSTRLARDFDHEAYWAKVIEFFVHQAELVIGHVGPIVEYLRFQKHFYKLEPPLPEKRKAVMRLLEQVAKWQTPTRATSGTPSIRWDSMGIKGLEYDEDATLESPDLDDPGIAR